MGAADRLEQQVLIALEAQGTGYLDQLIQQQTDWIQVINGVRDAMALGTVEVSRGEEMLKKYLVPLEQVNQKILLATQAIEKQEQAQARLNAALAGGNQGANAWAAAVAEGTQKAKEGAEARERMAEATTRQFAVTSGATQGAQAWAAAISEGTKVARESNEEQRRAQAEADKTAQIIVQAALDQNSAYSNVRLAIDGLRKKRIEDAAQAKIDAKKSKEDFDEQTRRSMAATRTVYFAAQAIEDFQYSFAATVNNIPMIAASAAQAMGKNAQEAMAWAAKVSIAAVAANTLMNNWDRLQRGLGMSFTATEAARMEELGKQTHRTAQEQAEFNRLKEKQADIEQMMASKTKDQKSHEEIVGNVLNEAQEGKVFKGLAESMFPQGFPLDPQQQERRALVLRYREALRTGNPFVGGGLQADNLRLDYMKFNASRAVGLHHETDEDFFQRKLSEIDKEASDVYGAKVWDVIRGAKKDRKGLESLITEVERNPARFPKGLAQDLVNAAAGVKPQAEIEQEGRVKSLEIARKARESDRRLGEELSHQGKINEFEGNEELQREKDKDAREAKMTGLRENEMDAELRRQAGAFASDQRQAVGQMGLRERILERIARGATDKQIRDRMFPQVRDFLGSLGDAAGVNGVMADPAAEILVKEAIAKARGEVNSQAGRRGISKENAAALLGAQADAKNLHQAGNEVRQAAQAESEMVGNRAFMLAKSMGATNQRALAFGQRTMSLFEAGMNEMMAQSAAWQQMDQRLGRAERAMFGMQARNAHSRNNVRNAANVGGLPR